MKTEREKRYSVTLFSTSCARWDGWLTPFRGQFIPGNEPVPLVKKAGWALEPVWKGTENLAPIGIQSPDRPARMDIAADAKVLVHAGLSSSPPCLLFKNDGLINKA
jgi:hypothetical protein